MTKYKHSVVQGLYDLIAKYGGGGRDPLMRAVWMGIKSQVPMLLEALDNSEEAIKLIEDKLREVLDVKEPEQISLTRQVATREEPKPKRIAFIGKKTPGKRRRRVVEKPVAEAEVTVEPEEESGGTAET